jgi:hypothetical protein
MSAMRQGTPLDVTPGDYLAVRQESRFERRLPYRFLVVQRLTKSQIVCAALSEGPGVEVRLYRDGSFVGSMFGRTELRTEAHIMLQNSARKRLSLDRDLRWLADHPKALDSDPIDMLDELLHQVRLTRARAEARMQTNEAKGAAT